MKFYIGDKLVRVDMVHRYRYAVMEGERVITFQKTRENAEAAADCLKASREGNIRRMEAALHQDQLARQREPLKISRDVWDDYHSAAEICAAIARMRRNRDSIRVVPLKITK